MRAEYKKRTQEERKCNTSREIWWKVDASALSLSQVKSACRMPKSNFRFSSKTLHASHLWAHDSDTSVTHYPSCLPVVRGTLMGQDNSIGTATWYGMEGPGIESIPVAAWSKAWTSKHSLAGTAGSNLAGDINACVVRGTQKTKEQARTIENKRGNVRNNTITLRRVRESLLPWDSNNYYILDCVCMRVRACMWVPGRVGVCMCISTCSLANPARNAYAPYCDVICGPSVSTIFFEIMS
jgi:hypothetical protein